MYRKLNTYKGKLSNIYAGQASQIHENATFSYISDFPAQLSVYFPDGFSFSNPYNSIKKYNSSNLDLDFDFQTFGAGSREEILCRIRI